MKSNCLIISCFMLASLLACKTDSELATNENVVVDSRIIMGSEDFNNLNIKLGSLESQEFPQTIKVNGVIDVPPQNKVIISAVRGGYIKTAPPIIGSSVEKGQLIVSIENPEFIELQQNYLETAQQLKYLQYEHERHAKMMAENVISEKNYMESENDYNTTKARYNGLKKQLQILNLSPSNVENGNISSSSNIHTPISGKITRVEVSRGSYISPEKEILEIINTDHIHLELVVYEKDISKINEGQSIKFNIPESSQKNSYNANVYLVNSVIDKNRTVRVHAHLENEQDTSFMVGMFVEAEIETSSLEMIAVPTTSIIDLDGNPQLMILDELSNGQYHFKTIDVSIGESHMGYTRIHNLNDEQYDGKIVIEGIQSLLK